jgi:class 3 adenylate cyclase
MQSPLLVAPMTEPNNSGTRVTKLLELALSDPSRLQELERFRQTLVVMFSDIKGSTAYFEKHGDAAGLFMVHQCNDTIRRLVEKHGGRVIKTIGDGTMATFPEPQTAVKSAIEIQKALAELGAARAEPERISLRIGMHYGTAIVRSNDLFGDVVNMASRVESVAAPGQIVVSEEIYEQVRKGGFIVRELGRFTLKGKAGERMLFRVFWDEVEVPAVAPADVPVAALSELKLQLIHKDGSGGTKYPVKSEVAVGLSREGKLVVSQDFHALPSVLARVFVEDKALFVEGRSAVEGVFLRLAGTYVLEQQDVFVVGEQIFHYQETPCDTPKAALPSTELADITTAMTAELVRTDAKGKPTGRYPLNAPEVSFGRTRGTYVFPDDNLMSRAHIRILQRGEDFVLEDVGSRNGTFVKVRNRTPISAGCSLLIAGQLLKVIH